MFYFYVYMCFAYMYVYMCITCVPDACGNQKKITDSLELELQVVMSCHVDAGNWEPNPSPFGRAASALTTRPPIEPSLQPLQAESCY